MGTIKMQEILYYLKLSCINFYYLKMFFILTSVIHSLAALSAASTSSESSCAATLQACNMLFDRLKPVLDRLQQQSENVSWDTLISQASLSSSSLCSCFVQYYFLL